MQRFQNGVAPSWSWFSDYNGAGNRIWIMWDNAEIESEICGQSSDQPQTIAEFGQCLLEAGLTTLPMKGSWYSWHNCSEGQRSLWKRLDRVLTNEAWLDTWPDSFYLCGSPRTSDHSPMVLDNGIVDKARRSIFRFDNFLTKAPGFLQSVQDSWRHPI
ncbi:UNVERIFIED_CONTAM: hypothetical protein Slati_4269400 [Sesamum latifolium]|uniref:Uncharacterized protein n=1 Tax=Sesamum latifolium TaxID=2727402 RepID=A0AAW2TCA8_9LAMI